MEEVKVAEVAVEAVNGVKGNLMVVGITVAATLAVTVGGYYGVKAIKKGIANRKQKKEKEVAEPATEEK